MRRQIIGMIFVVLACTVVLGCVSREEGTFQVIGQGYEVKEVRPGLTCVFTNGVDAGVSCVPGTFPKP